MTMIFDITNSKEYFNTERVYYNGLANQCIELLDELLVLVETTQDLKELEYRYTNLLVILRFIDVEYSYLQQVVDHLRTTGSGIRPVEFLMHLKNYLVHVDSFIDYLDGFLEVLSKQADLNYRFDRKSISEFALINSIRNQIHHESLPTVDYNHKSYAPAHGDFATVSSTVFEIRMRWPMTNVDVPSTDLERLINNSKDAIKTKFESIVDSLIEEAKKKSIDL